MRVPSGKIKHYHHVTQKLPNEDYSTLPDPVRSAVGRDSEEQTFYLSGRISIVVGGNHDVFQGLNYYQAEC